MIATNQETDWYSGNLFKLGFERAWHLTLASIQKLFNLSVTQWIYFPIFLHILSILSVYHFVLKLFGKKEALISALLTALIPSNVTIGGPVFIVPVNLSLIFIPLALTFAFELTKWKKLYNNLCLLIITTFILYAHPPTAMVLLTILGFYLLANLIQKDRKSKEKAKLLFLTIVFAILISLPNYIPEIQRKGLESARFNFWIYLREIPYIYGIIPTIFFIVGFYYLSQTKNKEHWSLLLTSVFLAFTIFLFARFGLNYLIPYQRVYIPLFLLMGIIASHGFAKLTEIKKPFKNLGMILLVMALISTTCFSVARNLKTPYYHVIDEKDYQKFLWIKDNTDKDAIVLLDPWKARAFTTIAERQVYAVLPFGPNDQLMQIVNNANEFLQQNCTDTTFLIENNISVVYSSECQNDNLTKVNDNIFLRTTSS
jgi:hypothetical protein